MNTRLSTAIRLAAFSLLLGAATLVQAQFNYTNNNGTITITGYSGSGGYVNIPGTINGLPVTSIGAYAFVGTSLTSVTIPDSVIIIGDYAFYNCTSLTAIAVGLLNPAYSSVDGVLFNKSQTTLIQYPRGKLGSYTIPNSVTIIADNAFSYCASLTAITVGLLNPAYSSVDGVLFNKSQTTLIQYPGGKLGSYTIPNSVTNIGNAFTYCASLTSLTIPNSVSSIGVQAFDHCTSLTGVTMGNSVAYIADFAFYFCVSLTNVTMGNSVTFIGYAAFAGCSSLTSVTFPNSVIIIGWGAFGSCTGLTNVTIPDSVTIIADGAFYNCTSLASVTIPSSVTSFGGAAFNSCTNLTAVFFEGNAPTLSGDMFYRDNNATNYYNPGTEGWGATYGDRPTALWVRPNPVILRGSVATQNNGFGFTISWATSASVVVEASTNLANPAWLPLATNTLANGTSYFSDPEWTKYPGRFYRIRSP